MKSSRAKPTDSFARLGVASRAAMLTAAVGAAWAVLAVAQSAAEADPRAGLALALAAGACWLGAMAGLVAVSLGRTADEAPQAALVRLLLATVARLAPPLVIATLAVLQRWSVLEAGLAVYLIVFYQLTLGLETAFSLPRATSGPRVPREAL